ncbi:HmuY family protein [Aureibacter tunicatorum]|uniref:HmuY protein n=1 Tax=Aureibacter tunicatorum TaxID=866807 RepID=A0AAE3XJH4_9BACT|nr:HmuY family protein [Aureibacter tunicatorum]MDR6238022.1 hypothetical protein [Aureibacter tunicatorum]BDD03055.1 hypothetical protein AUTU_05380 [Aureibacter tunicatorum]
MYKFRQLLLLVVLTAMYFLSGCSNDSSNDIKDPDLTVQFASSELGFPEDEQEAVIDLVFQRALPEASEIEISFEESNLTYGVDYITEPAAEAGMITLQADAGNTSISFKVIKQVDFYEGDETIDFTLISAGIGNVIGDRDALKLTFGQIISEGSELIADMGGSNQTHQVYIQLSANKMTRTANDAWDYAFYNGDMNVVKLNYAIGAGAISMEKTNFEDITADDIEAAKAKLPGNYADPGTSVDNPNGDLNDVALKNIGSDEASSDIYLVKLGTTTDYSTGAPVTVVKAWQLVQFVNTGSGYKMTYSDADGTWTDTSSMDVAKEGSENYVYASTQSASLVTVEPSRSTWDIAFTRMTGRTQNGPNEVAAGYKDYVIQNHLGSIEVAKVMIDESADPNEAFNSFTNADVEGLEFGNDQNTIGDDWRSLKGYELVLNTDRFYIVKDQNGLMYKLRFTSLGENERGYPQVQYVLL